MPSEKEIKKTFLEKTAANPDAFYPTDTFKAKGFSRSTCTKCGRNFWAQDNNREVCGDTPCHGGFTFIGNSPAKKKLTLIEAWNEYKRVYSKLGYTPINRYPVVSRWNPTTDFTIASIAAFQPFVVSGEVEPPANPLVIPQFCVRFTDIDNVGITGHHVGFVMLGQHAFVDPTDYDKDAYVSHHLEWLSEGMGIPLSEIIIHEDFWAGGGNFGPCVEFFSGGLEISNQVYMQYEITEDGYKELDVKVLDMGQGLERIPWFTNGNPTIYETSFPEVVAKLREITGLEYDLDLMTKFMPYAGYLNINEVEDMDAAWNIVSEKVGVSVDALKEKLVPQAALYSIAEHMRALLMCIADGALPSNVGGYYNLRVILRRVLGFIDEYNWNIDVCDVVQWHAENMQDMYPELTEKLANVQKILEVEKLKYRATADKTAKLVEQYATKSLSVDDLIELYDSKGISPQSVARAAKEHGVEVSIPPNFYALVAEKHEQKKVHTTKREEKIHIPEGVASTKALYFDNWKQSKFEAKVVHVDGNHIILDQTCFYPVSGGQAHDLGVLSLKSKDGGTGDSDVVDVFKQGVHIVHVVDAHGFKVGSKVYGTVDLSRRTQLAQHHTSIHIVNAAAKRVLGDHVNQAGARKDIDKAYIDITHYGSLNDEEMNAIEAEANKIIDESVEIKKSFMPRAEAEQKYGVGIYQGGVAPGKLLRIVNILDTDVEACGGTHLDNTSEAEHIKLVSSQKVKDGVVRITLTAGAAARAVENAEGELLQQLVNALHVKSEFVVGTARELFTKWKKSKKALKKKKLVDLNEFKVKSDEVVTENIIEETCTVLKSQPEHLIKTIKRFEKELAENLEKLQEFSSG